jgi:hypothetical protein
MKGIFLGEKHNAEMTLASAKQTQTTSTYDYCLYLRNQILRESSHLFALWIKKQLAREKERESIFSFLFSA